MFHLTVWLTVKDPSNVDQVRSLITESSRLSRAEPGCIRFDVYHSETEPTRFLLVEHWSQKSDWEIHRTGKAVTEIYVPKVLPLVERQAHVCSMVE